MPPDVPHRLGRSSAAGAIMPRGRRCRQRGGGCSV